jgi:hypothetical protein
MREFENLLFQKKKVVALLCSEKTIAPLYIETIYSSEGSVVDRLPLLVSALIDY